MCDKSKCKKAHRKLQEIASGYNSRDMTASYDKTVGWTICHERDKSCQRFLRRDQHRFCQGLKTVLNRTVTIASYNPDDRTVFSHRNLVKILKLWIGKECCYISIINIA